MFRCQSSFWKQKKENYPMKHRLSSRDARFQPISGYCINMVATTGAIFVSSQMAYRFHNANNSDGIQYFMCQNLLIRCCPGRRNLSGIIEWWSLVVSTPYKCNLARSREISGQLRLSAGDTSLGNVKRKDSIARLIALNIRYGKYVKLWLWGIITDQ